MFNILARFSVRFRWFIIIAWIVAVPLVVKNLPSLASVSQSNNAQFLPTSSPSTQAAKLAVPFEGKSSAATAVLVASSSSGQLTQEQNDAITTLEQKIGTIKNVSLVRDQGTSKDGQAREAIIGVESGASFSDQATVLIADIRNEFKTAVAPNLTFHLTGSLAEQVDQNSQSNHSRNNTQLFSILFILILLLIVYKSALAPIITLLPAGLSLVIAQPIIAEFTKFGLQVSPITQILLIVLILGAGTDYGIFLVFRVREELRRGSEPKEAVVKALSKVGVSITFSALTVAAALMSLVLASFGIYRGLGPALAIGLGVMLLSALTLLPALLAVTGRAAFWPSKVKGGEKLIGFWGSIADKVIKRPVLTLIIGVLLFGTLAAGVIGYRTTGFASTSASSTTTDSGKGSIVLSSHFPSANSNPLNIFIKFNYSVWDNLKVVEEAQSQLSANTSVFKAINGPNTILTTQQLEQLHSQFPSAASLPPVKPADVNLSPALYQAYRSTAQFISPDGETVQYYALLQAGETGSTAAMRAIPSVRSAVSTVAGNVGATESGVYGLDAVAYDVSHVATSDLKKIVPVVLVVIGILLAILLRSLVAPVYLIATVALSYLASLGFAMFVFVHFGGDEGLNFILPFLMFIFSMALGEDYNILVMSRIREEAHGKVTLKQAVTKAIGLTGSTVTSAGLILAGTFTVLALTGGSGSGGDQIRQIGFGIAFGILLDTLFVRTLLVPSIVVLLGAWNWWPSKLWRESIKKEQKLSK
jgi:RND superfamily putative drug exporter